MSDYEEFADIPPGHILAAELITIAHNMRELSLSLVEELRRLSTYSTRNQLPYSGQSNNELATQLRTATNQLATVLAKQAASLTNGEFADE